MRLMVKRDKTRKKLMVDHPDDGTLVFWKDLVFEEKKWAIRNYYKEAFDEAYNHILYELNMETNEDDIELAEMANEIGLIFLKFLSGFDPAKTRNTDRGHFREIRDSSSIGNKI